MRIYETDMKTFLNLSILAFFLGIFNQCEKRPYSVLENRWSEERALKVENYKIIGFDNANFNPSTSVNQLEFWQKDTYDPETIERELEWSAELGMNLHRVYLHNLLWDQDSLGFLKRIENYLEISESKGIKTLLVLLDDVWHPVPRLEKTTKTYPLCA